MHPPEKNVERNKVGHVEVFLVEVVSMWCITPGKQHVPRAREIDQFVWDRRQ